MFAHHARSQSKPRNRMWSVQCIVYEPPEQFQLDICRFVSVFHTSRCSRCIDRVRSCDNEINREALINICTDAFSTYICVLSTWSSSSDQLRLTSNTTPLIQPPSSFTMTTDTSSSYLTSHISCLILYFISTRPRPQYEPGYRTGKNITTNAP